MTTRYEHFNELLFESYCKTCIDNAIAKERKRKHTLAQRERSISALTDAELYTLSKAQTEFEEVEEAHERFFVRGNIFQVQDPRIGQAISYLLPRDREIILLYYFAEMNDDEIAGELGMSRATVQRRRTLAKLKLKELLEGGI